MMLTRSLRALLLACALLAAPHALFAQSDGTAFEWLDRIAVELERARSLSAAARFSEAQAAVIRVYLDAFEPLEGYYGRGGQYESAELSAAITSGEAEFHRLMRARDAAALSAGTLAVNAQLERIRAALRVSGMPASPEQQSASATSATQLPKVTVSTTEISSLLQQFTSAEAAYRTGDANRARMLVEQAYLEGFEPLESRLPADVVEGIERNIHLQLRPAIARGADAATVTSLFAQLTTDLARADRFLAEGSSVWFAVVNAFVIIVREGLEAVLLIAALLAYLNAIGAAAKHRRQIYAGVAAGVVASIGTWFLAATILPISGANRELLEGITALAAVVVLLYVANWLFQKTYIHDWKEYLRARVGGAVSSGSSAAMATLAFAAVYREGFETVLFYQALAFDAGVAAIMGGFIPGAILITAVGFGIIRAGLKLPLRKVFAITNAILLYLAFVFVGKGLYNLQEAGVFSPRPLPLPDHPALRQLFGFYPLLETVAAQVVLLLLLVGTYVVAMRAQARRSAQLPEPRGAARLA